MHLVFGISAFEWGLSSNLFANILKCLCASYETVGRLSFVSNGNTINFFRYKYFEKQQLTRTSIVEPFAYWRVCNIACRVSWADWILLYWRILLNKFIMFSSLFCSRASCLLSFLVSDIFVYRNLINNTSYCCLLVKPVINYNYNTFICQEHTNRTIVLYFIGSDACDGVLSSYYWIKLNSIWSQYVCTKYKLQNTKPTKK